MTTILETFSLSFLICGAPNGPRYCVKVNKPQFQISVKNFSMSVSFIFVYIDRSTTLCSHCRTHYYHYFQLETELQSQAEISWTNVSLLLMTVLGNQALLFPLWQTLVQQQGSCSLTHTGWKTLKDMLHITYLQHRLLTVHTHSVYSCTFANNGKYTHCETTTM